MLYEIRRYEILDNGKSSTSFAVLETETCKSRALKRAAFLHTSLNAERQGYNRRHPDKQKNGIRVVTYKMTKNGAEFVANAPFLN